MRTPARLRAWATAARWWGRCPWPIQPASDAETPTLSPSRSGGVRCPCAAAGVFACRRRIRTTTISRCPRGCAVWNLAQAALARGLKAQTPGGAALAQGIRVTLEATRSVATPLYPPIPERQSTRADFDGPPISPAELVRRMRAGTGQGVRVLLLTGQDVVEPVLAHGVEANTAQLQDPCHVAERQPWVRFGEDEPVRTGDGLYSITSGHPSVALAGQPALRPVLHGQGRERQVRQAGAQSGRHRRLRAGGG